MVAPYGVLLTDGQSQPRAQAHRLGGEERIEDARQHLGEMPGPLSTNSMTARPWASVLVRTRIMLRSAVPSDMAWASVDQQVQKHQAEAAYSRLVSSPGDSPRALVEPDLDLSTIRLPV
jgi:hypothetical protein